jgi:NIPSNAP
MDTTNHLKDFQVVELRRYTTKPGERNNFARYFETYFPEAFEQLGAIIFGQFLPREPDNLFVWLRGFKDMDARAAVNGNFYFGPLWREHSASVNNRVIDSDNVLLLRPLSPERAVPVLPAVDPIKEPDGAAGLVVAQIFAIKSNEMQTVAHECKDIFASYRATGLCEAGILVTLDVPNNFPRHPIRTDGPFLVWLGVAEDNTGLEKNFRPLADESAKTLRKAGVLRSEPELLIMTPTHRSRLRWLENKLTRSTPRAVRDSDA